MKGASSEPAVGPAVVEECISREPLLTLTSNDQLKSSQKSKPKRQEKKEVVSQAERMAAEKMDGRDIIRYMEQLGGTLDDIAGEEELKPKGRRGSGHKERAATPLKEKLLKSWGGSYLDRLDVVVGNSEVGGGQDQGQEATETASIFKPMFMQPPAPEPQPLPAKEPSLPLKSQKMPEAKKPKKTADEDKRKTEEKPKVAASSGGAGGRKIPAAKKAPPVPSLTMPPPPPPVWVSSVALDLKATAAAAAEAAAASTGKKRTRTEAPSGHGVDESDELRAKVAKLEVQVLSLKKDKKEGEDALKQKDSEIHKATGLLRAAELRAAELEKELKAMRKKVKEAVIKGAEEAKRAIERITDSLI